MKFLLFVVAVFTTTVSNSQPVAWNVSHPDYSGRVTILGSIHLLRESDYPLPSIVDELYAQADKVIFEIDLDNLNALQMQSEFLSAAMLNSETTLADVIATDLYVETANKAREYGVDLALFDAFEPWFVAINLLTYGLSELGYQSEFGIEQYILRKALQDGKEVLGIEALSAQIDVFDSLSAIEQVAVLEQTLAELGKSDTVMQSMVEAWRNGQLEELESELLADFAEYPHLYDSLLVERNTNWANDLEHFIADGSDYVMIVGALHLVGEHSVPALLRERGYRTEMIQ